MVIPTTAFGVFVLVALFVPGLVYAAVRTSLKGFVASDQSVTSRLLQAVMVSIFLDSLYLIILGSNFYNFLPEGGVQVPHPRLLGLLILALGLGIPALAAYLRYSQAAWLETWTRRARGLAGRRPWRWILPQTGYRSVPTAWDFIAPRKNQKFVRVLNAQGRWIGGWTTDDAFFSSYPEQRDLFIAEQWNVKEDGTFMSPTERSSGVWLSLEGAQLVEWIEPESESGNDK